MSKIGFSINRESSSIICSINKKSNLEILFEEDDEDQIDFMNNEPIIHKKSSNRHQFYLPTIIELHELEEESYYTNSHISNDEILHIQTNNNDIHQYKHSKRTKVRDILLRFAEIFQ